MKTILIDLDNEWLIIDGRQVRDIPVVLALPGADGWPREVLINGDKTPRQNIARISVQAEGLEIGD